MGYLRVPHSLMSDEDKQDPAESADETLSKQTSAAATQPQKTTERGGPETTARVREAVATQSDRGDGPEADREDTSGAGGGSGASGGGSSSGGGGPGGFGGSGSRGGGGSGSGPVSWPRARSVLGSGGWVRRLARLWGFLAFAVLVVVLARHVILPFIFALLIAYILAPIVQWMVFRKDETKRMPKGVAILACYAVIITFMVGFIAILLPLISKDVARIGAEAPKLYEKLNDEWAPKLAHWIEKRFPSTVPKEDPQAKQPAVAGVPIPPNTAFVVTPLPDGRLAIQLTPGGLAINAKPGGGYSVVPATGPPPPERVEDKIRAFAKTVLLRLQNKLDDVFSLGQQLVGALIRFIFTFVLVLMVAAFILLDLEKIHGFARGLFPREFRSDYDVIMSGINRGLSGVIRGQLLICLVNGVLTYIGMVIFDVKYAFILSVLAAILSLIPIFGSILSSIPVVLAAIVSGDAGIDVARGLFMLAWIVGIHFLEGNFLNPKIIGSAAKIHPVLVIFALIVGEHSYGLVGALLAVPVASIVQVIFLYFRQKTWKSDPPVRNVI